MPTGKPTYQKILLSGSTNGLPIDVLGNNSATATTIHTTGSTDYDEIWLFANNYSNTARFLSLEIGGTSAHQKLIVPIPVNQGLIPVCTGILLTGSNVVKAFSDSANVISIVGYINRIVYI